MVRDAEATARSAEAETTNVPGMCLQWSRQRADIPARWGTAAIAWANAERRHADRNAPRGAFVFWTGGSKGFGHIAVSLGGGNVRSTDAGGSGLVATRSIAWFAANWPSQTYAGWTDNVNGVTVPGVIERDWFDMASLAELRAELAPLQNKLDTLTERTDGLRVTLGEVGTALAAIDLELDGLASRDQVAKVRSQIRDLRALVTAVPS